MTRFLTAGVVAGALSTLGALTVASGHPALGAFLSDPQTAATLTTVASGVLALAAGVMKGVRG